MINREPIRPLLISSLLDYLTRQIYKAYEDPFHLKLKSFLKDLFYPTFGYWSNLSKKLPENIKHFVPALFTIKSS